MALLCNDVSHWLGASLESALKQTEDRFFSFQLCTKKVSYKEKLLSNLFFLLLNYFFLSGFWGLLGFLLLCTDNRGRTDITTYSGIHRHHPEKGTINQYASDYCQTSNIRCAKSQPQMFLVLPWSCLCPIYWSQVLSWEWRCSWSSADRWCSNYFWVINNFIAC